MRDDDDLPDPLLGSVFVDRYRIDAVLGRGGMGAVYRATQLAVGRPVAVKVLLPELSHRPKMAQRFRQEAELIANLHHPNIIALYDFGQDPDGRLYLVMELLAGQPLTDLLQAAQAAGTPLPSERIVALLRQVLDALAEAHGRGIVHRDLKPDNLFVADGGRRREIVKILDFGIAKIAETPDDPGITATGAIIGSARYIAPEQARAQPVTNRTDLYALGAILYEMIAGRTVFTGSTMTELLVSHCTETPGPITRGGKAVSGVLVDIALACLEKDPADRPESAEAILATLDKAGPDRLLVSGRAKTSSRWPIVVALALLLGVGVTAAVLLTRPRDEPPAALVPRVAPAAGEAPATTAPVAPVAATVAATAADVVEAPPEMIGADAVEADTVAAAEPPDAATAATAAPADATPAAPVAPIPLTIERYEQLVLALADCALANGSVDWHCAAASALADATNDQPLPEGRAELGKRLLTHASPAVRLTAVGMVAGGPDAQAILPEAAKTEANPEVLCQMIRSVANYGTRAPAVGELIMWASQHADASVRVQGAYGLANSWNEGLPGATDRLIALMNDAAPEVQKAACENAGALGDEVFLATYKQLTADTSDPVRHGACMRGLIALWYDYPFFEHRSEKAYRLTLLRLGQKPRSNDFPDWGIPGRFAYKADGFVRWTMKNKWFDPNALRKALSAIAADIDANWLARNGAIDSMVTHGATRAELTTLRARCADSSHVQQHIDEAMAKIAP